jgi:hypothetical protein
MYKNDYIERSNRRMAAIIAILFLLIAYTCSSQSNRDYPNKMKFSCGETDTLYVSIEFEPAFDVYHLIFSCTSHEHLEIKSITIGFEDGTALEVFRDYGWLITDEKLLFNTEFDYLSFDTEFSSSACINIRTKDYFTKYYSQVNK